MFLLRSAQVDRNVSLFIFFFFSFCWFSYAVAKVLQLLRVYTQFVDVDVVVVVGSFFIFISVLFVCVCACKERTKGRPLHMTKLLSLVTSSSHSYIIQLCIVVFFPSFVDLISFFCFFLCAPVFE